MKKTYVLDTNVLIYDPTALYKFDDNNIVLPLTVIKEIDSFKGEMTERGKNARETARILEKIRQSGSLITGADLPNDERLFIRIVNGVNEIKSFDEQILATALAEKAKSDVPVILVSMDINLRLMAEVNQLFTQDYKNQATNTNKLKNNIRTLKLEEVGVTDSNDLFVDDGVEIELEMLSNECFILKSQDGRTILAREKFGKLRGIRPGSALGISPKNREQTFAMEFLMDDDIKLVCLSGLSGCGKTILSSAVGLQKTLKDNKYNKMLISRPVMPMGKDIGYLPGSAYEKLLPYMKPIFDNMEYILMARGKKSGLPPLDKLMQEGIIEIEPLTYIRGRSIPQQFMLVDEAQNLSPHELKTIITRCGEGTKIVLTGDLAQIDTPYMTEATSGLAYVMDRLKDKEIVAQVRLQNGERSELANLAATEL